MNKLVQTNPFRLSPTALIMLILIVGGLLLFQVIGSGFMVGDEIPTNREACLQSGYIWSQSTGECYETGNATGKAMAKLVHNL